MTIHYNNNLILVVADSIHFSFWFILNNLNDVYKQTSKTEWMCLNVHASIQMIFSNIHSVFDLSHFEIIFLMVCANGFCLGRIDLIGLKEQKSINSYPIYKCLVCHFLIFYVMLSQTGLIMWKPETIAFVCFRASWERERISLILSCQCVQRKAHKYVCRFTARYQL